MAMVLRAQKPPPASRCDVAIVGAGLAGACAALLLAREGVEVVVLEAERSLGLGAFGLGPGLAMGWLQDHAHRLAGALGEEQAAALWDFIARGHALALELAGSGCWRPRQGLLLAGDAREADELRAAEGLGAGPVSGELTPERLRAEHGLRSAWSASLVRPAALVEPRVVLETLTAQAEDAGASLHLGRPVRDIDESGACPVVSYDGGTLQAELVLICAGLGSAALDTALRGWMVPVGQGGLLLEGCGPSRCELPLSCWYGRLRARPVSEGSWRLSGGRLEPDAERLGAGVERALVEALGGLLGEGARGARVSRRWVRPVAHTRDGLPLIGPAPGRVRRILCTGFADHDAGLAVAAAEAASRGVLGRPVQLPGCLQSRRLLEG